jgi:hypothetical protein
MLQIDRRIGGSERYILTSKPENLMIVPDEIRKCVVFVGEERSGADPRACGTAFFVAFQIEGTDLSGIFCITTKHTFIKGNFYDKVFLRLNFRDGKAHWIETERALWFNHPDPTVDLAFAPIPWQAEFDHQALPLSMVADDAIISQEAVGIGDEIFLTGLFSQHHGSQRNIPLLRVGNIAAMPEEPVRAEDGSLMDAYLVESRSLAGLSGSPVFVHLGALRPLGEQMRYAPSPIFYLLGVMNGHWNMPDDEAYGNDVFVLNQKEKINSGIAVVVPSQKIAEFFNQEEIKTYEANKRRDWLAKNAPVQD